MALDEDEDYIDEEEEEDEEEHLMVHHIHSGDGHHVLTDKQIAPGSPPQKWRVWEMYTDMYMSECVHVCVCVCCVCVCVCAACVSMSLCLHEDILSCVITLYHLS